MRDEFRVKYKKQLFSGFELNAPCELRFTPVWVPTDAMPEASPGSPLV
jgi:hypothetical protein